MGRYLLPTLRLLFKAHLDPEVISQICSVTNGNIMLGSKRFEEQIGKMLKRRVTRGKAERPSQRANELDQQNLFCVSENVVCPEWHLLKDCRST